METRLLFQIFQLVVIIVILIFLIRYFWSTYFDADYLPSAYKEKKKEGEISKKLSSLEKKYPDKVRFFNFWFQVERLKKDKIPGHFAELGVYKGKTAAILHAMDPDRILHLFDTFEGFVQKDLQKETGEAATYSPERFSDTAVTKVRSRFPSGADIRIHQGHFPGTTNNIGEFRFALVSLDVDLHDPTREGLKYFYPRLSPGGVIIIHDYNNKWEGLVKAVDEFVKDIPESLIPVADMETSVMIIRQKTKMTNDH